MDILVFFFKKILKICKKFTFLMQFLTIFQGNFAFFPALITTLMNFFYSIYMLLLHLADIPNPAITWVGSTVDRTVNHECYETILGEFTTNWFCIKAKLRKGFMILMTTCIF